MKHANIWKICDLVGNSGNQCFPKDRCMILQNHVWVKVHSKCKTCKSKAWWAPTWHWSGWLLSEKSTNNKQGWGCEEQGSLVHCWWDCKLLQPLWSQYRDPSENQKMDIPYDTAIPLLDTYLKKTKTQTQKDTCTPMFTAALFTTADIWKHLGVHG